MVVSGSIGGRAINTRIVFISRKDQEIVVVEKASCDIPASVASTEALERLKWRHVKLLTLSWRSRMFDRGHISPPLEYIDDC